MKTFIVRRQLPLTIVLLMAVFCVYACQLGSMKISYVFPDQFRGPAVIRENQPDGIVSCTVPLIPGTHDCVLNFPPSGVLSIKGQSPGRYWHEATARYGNGTKIHIPDSANKITIAKDQIGLWSYGSIQNGDWLFVGTEDEFVKFKEQKQRNNDTTPKAP